MIVTLGINSSAQDSTRYTLQNTCRSHSPQDFLLSQDPESWKYSAIFRRNFLNDVPLSWILRAIASHWQLGLGRIQWTINPWMLLLQQWESEGQSSHIYALLHSVNHIYNFPSSDTHLPPAIHSITHFKKKIPYQLRQDLLVQDYTMG